MRALPLSAVPLSAGLLLAAVLATPVLPTPALAQDRECAVYPPTTERACQAAVDATRAFHPIYGLLVSGGNPVLGTGDALGGLGHLSVTARVNATRVVLPSLAYDGRTNTVPAGDKMLVPAPLLEAALGVYGGSGSGLLAVDLLGSAQFLPTTGIADFTVEDGASHIGDVALGWGYGARVGLLREIGPLPGLSVSVMRRDNPRVTYGDIAGGGQYQYDVNLHATNLRVVASKRVLIASVAAGLGWDKYTGDATIQFRDPLTTLVQPPVPLGLSSSRVNTFIDAGFDLAVVKLVGELGYQFGRDQKLSTNFEDFDTTKGKLYGGLGLRVGL